MRRLVELPAPVGFRVAGDRMVVKDLLDWRVVFWAIAPVPLLLLPLVLPGARRTSAPPPPPQF